MPRRFLSLLLMVVAAASFGYDTVLAQNNPIVGSWKVTFAAGARIENGTPTTINGTGTLIVQPQGDSLVARLIPDPIQGAARPESRLTAASGAGKVVFTSKGKAQVNANGDVKEVTSISTWILSATGDALTGTVERKIEGMDAPSPGPQPVRGTRIKG
jgi:hypothetical protein